MTASVQASTTVSVDPAELAAALGLFPPTPEQAEIIAAPPGPLLVVAGAGAGKTETMAARVVWMVANGFVRPEEVLGLTFTRKAAQQLTTRIRQRLARLAGSDLLSRLDPSGELRRTVASGDPEVSTYHAYAGRLLDRHGMVIRLEPSTTLVSETELWQLAHRVVAGWDGEIPFDRTPASVTESVLALSGQLAEHLVDPADLLAAHDELETLIHHLPAGPGQRGGKPKKDLLSVIEAQENRAALLPLVARLQEVMTREGLLDFGRQMSLAARVAAEHPDVGKDERARCRLVLLDEYQDTGHAQRVLLSSLFGGGRDPALTVTAVGDPMQSIYGWRGASAANLPRFETDFPSVVRSRGARVTRVPAPTRQLSTSWRNPPEALALANAVAAPLRMRGVSVDELRARPDAPAGDIRLAVTSTVDEERQWIADVVASEYRRARDEGRPPPTAAVLVRRNADAEPVAETLRRAGLPVEVVGLGGLLRTPEVADLVAMLRLVSDPLAGSAAMRVLTGSRWQLGASDLRALWRRAREIAAHSGRGRTGEVTDAAELGRALEDGLPGERSEQSGLVDAIADPGDPSRYSPAGFVRIRALGDQLHALRRRMGQPLPDLVADVERVLGIGVEAGARRQAQESGGREHLDAFADVVADYADQQTASLTGLLSFLSAADSVEDGLPPGEVDVDPHRVQVLTVHAAKGLEWEIVAVPHVCEGVFPSTRASASWLGSVAELPTSLRGDRATDGEDVGGVPVLDLSSATHRGDVETALTEHKAALARRRLDEDRRLFYVALTRTERVLLASAHQWAPGASAPRGPSSFLTELHATVTADTADTADTAERAGRRPVGSIERAGRRPVGRIGSIHRWDSAPPEGSDNPYATVESAALWPADPLGARRDAVESGASAVRAALADPDVSDAHAQPGSDADLDAGTGSDPEGWARDVELLLTERDAVIRPGTDVMVPRTMSVSQVVHLVADPDALASSLRRPVPYPPNPLARRGTAFHAWVERRFGATRLLDLDELPGAADGASTADADLEELQRAFDASPWALRSPVEVEVPFETSVGGIVLRGRMDAVFADADGGWTVVDWKTGARPTAAEERSVAVQLAAYRIAWAELASQSSGSPVPLHMVRAAFHYVRSGVTISPPDLPGADDLAAIVTRAGGDAAEVISRRDTPSGPR